MPQLDQLSACPGCGEPREDGDRFCGVCGTALRPPAARPADPVPAASAPAAPPTPTPTPTEPDFTLPPPRPRAVPPPPPGPAPQAGPQRPDGGPLLPSLDPRTPPAPAVPTAVPDPRAAGYGEDPAVTCAACGNGRIGVEGYCEECGRAQPRARDHVERALDGVAAVSDLGLRHHRNEDAFTVSATALPDGSPAVIAVVCDGVSSSWRPDEASAAAADAALESLLGSLARGVSGQQAMHDALVTAGVAVTALAGDADQQPGRNAPACTIVSAVTAGGTLTVGWIGDSRVYWVPEEAGAAAARLTEDDSWAAQMVAAGLLSETEAMRDHRAHAITAWLGADAQEVEPHTASFKPDRPGTVVVCTDGLWNYAEGAEEMARLVPGGARTAPLPSARGMVRHALDSGGHDNVTVVLIPFPVAADRAETA